MYMISNHYTYIHKNDGSIEPIIVVFTDLELDRNKPGYEKSAVDTLYDSVLRRFMNDRHWQTADRVVIRKR